MPQGATRDVRSWLAERPPLGEVRAAYPGDWAEVEARLREAIAGGGLAEIQRYVAGERNLVRRYLAVAALRQMSLSAATGVTEGSVRFNRLNGMVAQRLLFRRGLERKPVSLRSFRLVWPRLPQRRFLMPLVEPKGIYCFYSRSLVARLAELIGGRSCLEIAAGDGTLSRFLAAAGVDIVATDDFSWSDRVEYPDDVERLDAAEALRRHEPAVVLCSWPPPGNAFERRVFATPSVELYVVIGSRQEFATGNWDDYRRQRDFELERDDALGELVLPPEIEPAVYVFRRRRPASPPASSRRAR